MSVIGFIILLVTHFIAGYGVVKMFKINVGFHKTVALMFITGVIIHSLIPFLLELCHIPITLSSVFISIVIVCIGLNISEFKNFALASYLKKVTLVPRFKIYEWPFIILLVVIIFSSVWRAYYYPPISRDALSGPEVIAEYTVKEHTMINSVFSVNLETTNNHQKSPYLIGLQVIYKLAGFPFGQLWLPIISIAFIVFMYHAFRETLHPIFAGFLVLVLVGIPEMYAYSYIILYDYSNMILFFLGIYFLFKYFDTGNRNYFSFGALMFAFATYIRLETLALIAMFLPVLWLFSIKHKVKIWVVFWQSVLLMSLSCFFYILWMHIYMAYYMPEGYSVASQVNKDLFNFRALIDRFISINIHLLFGKMYAILYAYVTHFFIALFLINLAIYRKWSKQERNWLYAALVVYLGLPLLGHILPLMDISNTTKRGLFKLFPLLLMVLANSSLLMKLSKRVSNWENDVVIKQPVEKSQSPAPAKNQPVVVKKNKPRK